LRGTAMRRLALFWLMAFLVILGAQAAVSDLTSFDYGEALAAAIRSAVPLAICLALVPLLRLDAAGAPYLLFFAISITSFLGLTETLTGSHAESSSLLLYGLSFYTASLAFLVWHRRAGAASPLVVSNPLLLVTGPIATAFGAIRHHSLRRRVRYYAPFVILGLFLHQAIATPLTQTFGLLSYTDAASSLVFATIFELFVYANFCGLSLVVYGVAGIIGFRVPLNFRQPFSATNVVDFWRGWHTSLSTVLRALFYAPTRNRFGTTAALFCVYIASAMWHGVTLNFLIWGTFHAAMFVLTLHLLRAKRRLLPLLVMVVAVIVGRMIFADADASRLLAKLQFDFAGFGVWGVLTQMPNTTKLALLLVVLFVLAEFAFRNTRYFFRRNYKFYRLPVVQLALLLITLTTITSEIGIDYAVYGQR
jgi:alginate O-acetyltransferase complex protein AlgI